MTLHNSQKQSAQRMSDILAEYRFFYDVDTLLSFSGSHSTIELTGKAYGDSYDVPIENVIKANDLEELGKISKKLSIKLPEFIYFD